MKELVDLYAKLLIGTFSFIGPSFTLFISFFYDQLERSLEEYNIQLATFSSVTKTEEIRQTINGIEKAKKSHNPHIQVKKVFGSLLFAILFIGFYYFQHTHYWNYSREWIRITTICVSIALFLYCLTTLWQVFCIIIEAKKSEGQEKKRKETKLKKLRPLP